MPTKLFSLVTLTLLLSAYGLAQADDSHEEQSLKRSDVPKLVLAAFGKTYPKAKIKGYSKEETEGKTVFEVESTEEKLHRDVTYLADGSLVSVEETLPFKDLPMSVQEAIKKSYPKHKVESCEKVVKGSVTEYEAQLKLGKEEVEVVYDSAGKEVKKEKK